MNDFFKNIIEETFASKKQQRFFYAQAGKGGKKGKKWAKWAKEFSDKTDFDKLPDEVSEKEVDEIVDTNGNIKRGHKPGNFSTKFVSPKKDSDTERNQAKGSMGMYGVTGTVQAPQRYWAEADMSKALGSDIVLDDMTYEEGMKHLKDQGIDEIEADKRLRDMGLIPKEPELRRLVENPKKFIEDYVESVLSKKNTNIELVNSVDKDIKPKLNPVLEKQINSLRKSLKNNNLQVDEIIEYLKNEQ